ncbi:unnamed protein product [Polarella glacialis]|uniref:U-box domain-containing protein n=2 Tax=Polarella glacialis TaxID=89957 RepID=A0A813KFS7_POLGL|nr:unnamed protein product [Polarella glacialis]
MSGNVEDVSREEPTSAEGVAVAEQVDLSPASVDLPSWINELFEDPKELSCPISQDIMQDPVVAADGNSYNREHIMRHFASRKGTSPLTNERMESHLTENRNLCHMVELHKSKLVHRVLKEVPSSLNFQSQDHQEKFEKLLHKAERFMQHDKGLAEKFKEDLLEAYMTLPKETNQKMSKCQELVELLVSSGRSVEVLERFNQLHAAPILPMLDLTSLLKMFLAATTETYKQQSADIGRNMLRKLVCEKCTESRQNIVMDLLKHSSFLTLDREVEANYLATLLVVFYQPLCASKFLAQLDEGVVRCMSSLMASDGDEHETMMRQSVVESAKGSAGEVEHVDHEEGRSDTQNTQDTEGSEEQVQETGKSGGECILAESIRVLCELDESLSMHLARKLYGKGADCMVDGDSTSQEQAKVESTLLLECQERLAKNCFTKAAIAEVALELGHRASTVSDMIRYFRQATKHDDENEQAQQGLCDAHIALLKDTPQMSLKERVQIFKLLTSFGDWAGLADNYDMLAGGAKKNKVLFLEGMSCEDAERLADGLLDIVKPEQAADLLFVVGTAAAEQDPSKAWLMYDKAVRIHPDCELARESLLDLSKSPEQLKRTLCVAMHQSVQANDSTGRKEWTFRVFDCFIDLEVRRKLEEAQGTLRMESEAQLLSQKFAHEKRSCETDALQANLLSRDEELTEVVNRFASGLAGLARI